MGVDQALGVVADIIMTFLPQMKSDMGGQVAFPRSGSS